MYPRFLYHPEHAPSGRLIRSDAEEPTGPGWVDTPQKFDPTYVEPAPAHSTVGIPADRPGYVPVAYPSFRYSASGESRLVKNAEEDAALDPADWKHSPAEFPAVAVEAPAAPVAPLGNAASMKAELYSASAKDVIAKVNEMSDITLLQVVKGFEEGNPKKRATVITAVDKRLAELGYVAPQE